MDWQNHMIVDPKILVGKPIIKGTRLAVEFIVDLLAQGCPKAKSCEITLASHMRILQPA